MGIVDIVGDNKRQNGFHFPGIFISIIIIAVGTIFGGIPVGLAIALAPMLILFIILIIKQPYWGLIATYVLSYFLIYLIRYTGIEGLSVLIDIFMAFTIMSIILNSVIRPIGENKHLNNGLLYVSLIWTFFCIFEVFNPTAMVKAWFLSRGLIYHFPIVVILTFLLFKKNRDIYVILYILSVLTIIGVAKGLIQKFVGFDSTDMVFLNTGGAKTHLLSTGTRYFSIYASAGIFGAVMGYSMTVFGIASIYAKTLGVRIYFIIVSLLSLYGLLISGTRGAIAVPFVGLLLFLILSRKIRILIPSAVVLVVAYVFFAHTTMLQGNEYVRRMRTAFDPNEPSLVVRRDNQALFREYLVDKPFGEGLGLSGVEAQDLSMRFTTSIPTDSWFVKIWVETGAVGIILYLLMLIYVLIHGSYILLFKVKNDTLRGVLSALLCGVAGVFVSSYGNQVLGQFPVAIIVYMSIAFVFMAPYIDKQLEDNKE